ncbi:ScbA/BarX family gamma-butyrolactone biosynthesis protein [Streptacidiphilus albus]|uniref:ScbA/BarX family gamma-butyrolactone biosynthesis protein n=1 Tax=Streptacidiphilus albus TaxID=105425 RepID=UPI000689D402|nr:ScbA/BarX family gamma-butyrolactone biosynthesis protein [Streptacidiphilus albus]
MSTALLEHSAPASTQPAATIAELVHKTRTADVLLTRWRTTGPDTHHVTAELPPTHGFYRPRHGLHDPLLLAEAVRQSIPLLTHAAYGAPPGDRQAWRDLGLRLDPTALAALAAGTGPTTLDLHITCTEVVMRARRPAAARMQVQITAQGRHLATATTTFTNHSPTVYNRLRGHHADPHHTPTPPGPPLPPAHVARTHTRDVVLSPTPTPTTHLLRTDPTHPGLFDHPLDHAPGMLLLEAARQAAHTTTTHPRTTLTALHCTFHHYAELDTPCTIHTHPHPTPNTTHTHCTITATQNNQPVITATVQLQPPPHH